MNGGIWPRRADLSVPESPDPLSEAPSRPTAHAAVAQGRAGDVPARRGSRKQELRAGGGRTDRLPVFVTAAEPVEQRDSGFAFAHRDHRSEPLRATAVVRGGGQDEAGSRRHAPGPEQAVGGPRARDGTALAVDDHEALPRRTPPARLRPD